MSSIRWIVLLGGVGWLTGCDEIIQSSSREPYEELVPYVSAAEFKAALAEQTRPILIEFCVPVGCFRCDEMRPQVNQLAQDKSDGIEVVRVNLNQDRDLAVRIGVTVCPSYIAFDRGQELFRTAYPTSGDLIASELNRVAQNSITD